MVFPERSATGETVRIFTGAPVPAGTDTILIQENAEREGERITVLENPSKGAFVRPAGLDFSEGDVLLQPPLKLAYRHLALAAAMNHAVLPVHRRPKVAILATGDELVRPGTEPGPDQIIASNHAGIAALVEDCGGQPLDLGISPDEPVALANHVRRAITEKADILVTLGGASVGDHDLVQSVLGQEGMDLAFWRIAMRPGKPLMAGRLGGTKVLGLPGNPVSSLICGLLFLKPLMQAMLGQTPEQSGPQRAILASSLPENDRRQDYVRATLSRFGTRRSDRNAVFPARQFHVEPARQIRRTCGPSTSCTGAGSRSRSAHTGTLTYVAASSATVCVCPIEKLITPPSGKQNPAECRPGSYS